MGEKQKTTLIRFVLDETGSMSSALDQTITGFNEYIDILRASEHPMKMSLTKFNSLGIDHVFTDLDVGDVPKLSKDNYRPSAMTPLQDAVGQTIHAIDVELIQIRKQKKSLPLVLCVVLTDGFENASVEYTKQQIFDMVQDRERQGWTFVFLGADQDAWAQSSSYGYSVRNTMSYDSVDTRGMYRRLANSTVAYAAAGTSTSDFFIDNTTNNA